jgi:hypothetical protein
MGTILNAPVVRDHGSSDRRPWPFELDVPSVFEDTLGALDRGVDVYVSGVER